MRAAGGTMLRIDVDAHVDESEATWEYLDASVVFHKYLYF
jgi:hypothetical protein